MKLLLAIDATPASQTALREVAERPWPTGTSVELLTVAESLEPTIPPARALIAAAARRLQDAGLHPHCNIACGDPKAVILDRAEDIHPDLLVLGSHRRSAIGDIFLGNVASRTVRHAPCSVAIVRPRPDDAVVPRRILLATDGSTYAAQAARAIANRPWPEGSEVRILSVVEVILPSVHALFDPPFLQSEEVRELRAEALGRAQQAIADASAILAPAGLEITESLSVLIDGTKDVILREAREWGADWLFVGSHGRRGAERFLMGSVSESLAAQACCSVEVVRERVI